MAPPRTKAIPKPRVDSKVVLSATDVSVTFGGLAALSDVSLEVREGEIVGLLGPNGAGKTTLMECISGFQFYERGTITYRGDDLKSAAPDARAKLGIGRTLQNVRLFPYLSVLDNIRVALHIHHASNSFDNALRLPSTSNEESRILERAVEVIDLVGLGKAIDSNAADLSYGMLRLCELACMIALESKLLLLDEPSSGLSQTETKQLGPLLKKIRDVTSSSVLMIEHDMPLIMGMADWMYVLDVGTNICQGDPQAVAVDERVVAAYLGVPRDRATDSSAADTSSIPGPRVANDLLVVENMSVSYGKVQVLYDIDFSVGEDEKVALVGTNGAGKSTVLKAVSGLVGCQRGRVVFDGKDITELPAYERVKLGLSQVPGGRGLFPNLTVQENLKIGAFLIKDEAAIRTQISRVSEYFPWIPERLDQPAATLSGGEQQQLSIARALLLQPKLLMIDELSLGLAPIIVERLVDTLDRLHADEGTTLVVVEQQAAFALDFTDRAYFLEKGQVRFEGRSSDLQHRADLLRSVFLAGALEEMEAR